MDIGESLIEPDVEMLESEAPSREDLFYVEWGRETLKENIPVLNDVFKLFITLDTLLLSIYWGLYGRTTGVYLSIWEAVLPAGLVTLSLIVALMGIYPFPMRVNLAVPQLIKEYKERRVRFKSICLAISSIALVVGFIVLIGVKIVHSM